MDEGVEETGSKESGMNLGSSGWKVTIAGTETDLSVFNSHSFQAYRG